jgi:anthranilate synthase component II
MKLLVLDNYDSFTYNLVHLLRQLGVKGVEVLRNDKITLDAVSGYDKIVLSPGPGVPREAGIMPELVRRYAATRSILGVCLGHQCIGEVFGATLVNMRAPVHGKATATIICDPSEPLFAGVPSPVNTGRYHSWLVSRQGFPADLVVTAKDTNGDIMALRHQRYNVRGVQFHPESVLTEHGQTMVKNWLAL